MDQWNVKEIMIEMTNLSIGYACIQPDAHHLCITIILGILARFHPGDRWPRGWGRLTPCTSSKRIPRVVSVSVYLFLSFFLFFFFFFLSIERVSIARETRWVSIIRTTRSRPLFLYRSLLSFTPASWQTRCSQLGINRVHALLVDKVASNRFFFFFFLCEFIRIRNRRLETMEGKEGCSPIIVANNSIERR